MRTSTSPKSAWGPRVGVAYDLTGNGTSAVRAFWGRYYEGAASAFYTAATPGRQDLTYTPINPDGSLGTPEVVTPAQIYGISADIEHPRTDEFNLSWEGQLTRTIRFTATGIWRDTGNFVNNVIAGARFSPLQVTNALTGQPLTVYSWANSDASSDSYFIRNTAGFQYLATDGRVIGSADPNRKYRGLMLLLDSSLRNRFGYQVSYVLVKGHRNGRQHRFRQLAERADLELAEYGPDQRRRRADQLQTARVQGLRVVSRAAHRRAARRLVHRLQRTSVHPVHTVHHQSAGPARVGATAGVPGAARLRTERLLQPVRCARREGVHDRGAPVRPFRRRLQPVQHGDGHDRQPRYPNTTISGAPVAYRAPTAVQGARQVTFGARWMF